MKTAIYATLFHSILTDQKPQHFKCPTGKDSWFFFQAALARGEVPGPPVKHVKTPLKETHLAKIMPIHWCRKIKDEFEKLAYQLNEEAERTGRPIRRLSKVMYRSTCADMQVVVMGECLSSIKHDVGVRSVFLAKRLHAV
ncbi:uncharacterized protein TNCV_2898691 [Trichonephila clavipes]|nr:uncharacterized protein TNCV_2898691 [Trichonephila clavipes]